MPNYPEELFDLREKVRNGEKVTAEEYKTLVDSLRENRVTAAVTKKAKDSGPSKTGMKEVDLGALFSTEVTKN